MAYKYLNDDGLKAYTKKVKGALKDLHTPIAISTDNTTESKAQNVRNMADFVAKAKAAGIADVNGMAVTCTIRDEYFGVGYFGNIGTGFICGIVSFDDVSNPYTFAVDNFGEYTENEVLTATAANLVTSSMLTQGARKPIILDSSISEVDEGTYQKLISDDVDVVFKTKYNNLCTLTYKYDDGDAWNFYFTCFSFEGDTIDVTYIYAYIVNITKNSPHTCHITENISTDLQSFINGSGYLSKYELSPVLQQIDLTGTDADRKAKLDKFEADWKALTGASDLTGARFVGQINSSESNAATVLLQYNSINVEYEGISISDDIYPKIQTVRADPVQGYLTITPLFSHLEAVAIKTSNSTTDKSYNIKVLQSYIDNLVELGVVDNLGVEVPICINGTDNYGILVGDEHTRRFQGFAYYDKEPVKIFVSTDGTVTTASLQQIVDYALNTNSKVIASAINEVNALANAVKDFGAIELKASDNAANKAILTAYKKILTDAGISITNGYSVPVRITGNTQEYHGMLNIGTGALLSGIVTDANENHYYPFNVNTADGAITFDANNYFLEKTSNEVTEMLDAIKYSYTPVPLTATTSTNKTQLDLFLSKVPNAQIMHCTYKDVYAGTLHKINGAWYGVLVGESNTLAGQLSIKLQADGTIVEGTA